MNIENIEAAQHASTIATLINQLDDLNFNRDFSCTETESANCAKKSRELDDSELR